MATSRPDISPGHADPLTPCEALFEFSRPLKVLQDGAVVEIHGVGMRALDTCDLALLDQFRGGAVALAQNAVALLSGLSVEQVAQLSLDDFTMLSADVLFQIEQVAEAMGLPPAHFLDGPAKVCKA